MNQQQFIQQFNADPRYVYQMNPDLFTRDDNEIVRYMQMLYLSIQKTMGYDAYFTIRINKFTVIEDYDTVREILSKYQEAAIKKSVKLRGATENRFNFIDLRESDVKILVVEIFIEAYDGREILESVLAIPRVIDGQYININGNIRQMMLQLVDASTYNNQTSSSKNPMVVFKTQFQPIKVYRNTYKLHTITNEDIDCVNYDCDTFSKSLPACEYFFARMGLIRGLQFLGLDGAVWIHTTPPTRNPEEWYIFQPKSNVPYYVAAPRFLYNVNPVLQHVIYTLVTEGSRKFMNYDAINTQDIWLEALGRHFSLATPRSKACSVISSFEMVYDLITREITRLDPEDMLDSYTILRWIIYEYAALIVKSNLDVYAKRVRCGEYAAYMAAPKLSKAIYTLGDMGDRVSLAAIRKRIVLPYDYLLNELGKESIVVFNDLVTDCDAFSAISYSRNGPSAINDGNGSSSMPVVYRYLHPTSLGILDDSASGNSQPGLNGVLCPLVFVDMKNGGYFNPNYKEPSTWREVLSQQWAQYDQERTAKEVVDFRRKILEQSMFPDRQIKDFILSEEDKARLLATANR